MNINGIEIDDTFAEAFSMVATRLIITAASLKWARIAAEGATGFATSVIACGCEAGIEREWSAEETPDGRVGVSILLFTMKKDRLATQIKKRVGQCILTCPTTACYAGLYTDEMLPLGKTLRYFGDGWQISKMIQERRYWRIPVMEGEFLCEETTGVQKAIGGGNFLVLASTPEQALAATECAVNAIAPLPDVILPFPAGIARSGSKVGSKYKALLASTNEEFCPTLKNQVNSCLGKETGSVLEVIIDGMSRAAVEKATRVGIEAICALGAESGVHRISAGNYGGRLGKHHFKLHEIMV